MEVLNLRAKRVDGVNEIGTKGIIKRGLFKQS